ncbi:hypothetical protein PRIC1_014625 [Phytophthora ramorum]
MRLQPRLPPATAHHERSGISLGEGVNWVAPGWVSSAQTRTYHVASPLASRRRPGPNRKVGGKDGALESVRSGAPALTFDWKEIARKWSCPLADGGVPKSAASAVACCPRPCAHFRFPTHDRRPVGRSSDTAHFPFSQSRLGQQLFLPQEGPVTSCARAILDLPRRTEEHGQRWGAHLARLGLLLVNCLLRPFLASPPPSSQSMRTLPPADTAKAPAHKAEIPADKSVLPADRSLAAAVLQRLSMDAPASTGSSGSPTNSSSEPSPQAADAKALLETKPPQQEQEQDAVDVLQETLLRQSTGSIAIMTRQQEAFDHRRHTFSAMAADSRANMRRRSYDLSATFGSTYPPSSPHSLKTHHHLQHLRVYGKSAGSAKRIGECHEEGAPLVALVTPNPDTVWTRGKPVDIEWKVLDAKVEKLRIELLEDGLSATTLIAREAPNSGFFTYHRVPWGMESGSKYFLRVSAVDAPERFRTSSFFQISSAP